MQKKVHTIDAKGKPMGRLATEVANALRGKTSPLFTRHIAATDIVHVVNVGEMALSGRKREQKEYYHYSGYPGGLKTTKLKDVMVKDPGDALKRAVYGMLPKNKLRALAMKRLFTHTGSEAK